FAIAARVVGGEDHAPCGSRPDRRPRRRRQVDARVEAGATRAERAADRRLQRPGERDRAARQRRPEGAESAGAGDAVRRQVRPALELDQRALGVAAEAAVDGGIWKAVPRECELELGDVPAGHASREAARAQHVPREAAEGASGLWAGDPVRGQSMEALEAHHGRGRRPSGDPVDRRRSPTLRLKALATLAAIAMLAVPTARAEQPHPFAGHRQVTVMSQNLYLGTDLNPIFAAANPFALFAAVGAAWGQVQANDFPARAQVIANEIAAAKPDLVGLP